MELKVEKFNDLIVKNCRIIKTAHKTLTDQLKNYKYDNSKRDQIDRNLVKLSVASQRIIDLILPIPSSGEIFGLPKEATEAADDPDVLIVDKENTNYDFRPWFAEKTGALKSAINKLMANLETNPADIDIHPLVDITALEHLRSLQNLYMAEIHQKADVIQEMIESGRLSITDVRLVDDDDEDWDDDE
jgi:hypothetical protein